MVSHIKSKIVKDDCYPYTQKRVNKQTRDDTERWILQCQREFSYQSDLVHTCKWVDGM